MTWDWKAHKTRGATNLYCLSPTEVGWALSGFTTDWSHSCTRSVAQINMSGPEKCCLSPFFHPPPYFSIWQTPEEGQEIGEVEGHCGGGPSSLLSYVNIVPTYICYDTVISSHLSFFPLCLCYLRKQSQHLPADKLLMRNCVRRAGVGVCLLRTFVSASTCRCHRLPRWLRTRAPGVIVTCIS